MAQSWRRPNLGAQRFADRRRREDEAPRLSDRIPKLSSMRFEVNDKHGPAGGTDAQHTRHIMVDRAPALFLFPCSDRACQEGGHDVTDDVMRHLLAGDEKFTVSHVCEGAVSTAPCSRTLEATAAAIYRAEPVA
jgi:hypothetical protein